MHRHSKLVLGVGWLLAAMSAMAADLTISGIYTRYADATELGTVAIGAGELVAITSNEVPTGRMIVRTDGLTGYSYVFDEGGDFDWTGAHDFSAATVTLLDAHIPTSLTISSLLDADGAWATTTGTVDGEDFRLILGSSIFGFTTHIDINDASSTISLNATSVVVPDNSISAAEVDEGGTFDWTGPHTFDSTVGLNGLTTIGEHRVDMDATDLADDEYTGETISGLVCGTPFDDVL